MPDYFVLKTKEELGARAGWLCSNPTCRQSTSGPSETDKRTTNVGIAAHITAASQGGSRYDPSLSSEERKATDNGIWLCAKCAKLIDDDENTYPVELLRHWRLSAEEHARRLIESGPESNGPRVVNAVVFLGNNAIKITGGVSLGSNAIQITHRTAAPGGISKTAQKLLAAGAEDRQGIIVVLNMLHKYSVQVGDVDYVESDNARSEAQARTCPRACIWRID